VYLRGMSNKVWFITGCSSGFGRELALAALNNGDKVIATARKVEGLSGLVEQFPDTCRAMEFDVTDFFNAAVVFENAVAAFGQVDVLVNNAGYGLIGSIEESSKEQIDRNFAVNFFGPLELIRVALPHFRAHKSGHVVNISAAAVISNYAGFGIYGAAKSALESLSEALALEGRGFGLKVTLVQPGPFRTDFIARSLEKVESEISEYAGTAGKFGKLIESMDGRQPGDPARAAQAILQAVAAERPPLRLVLGKYAIEKSRRDRNNREAELREWESAGLSADGPYL
jgi:NAD(P)-dependent dehydrogenase (short-subunit alcohol dehydrogenase family)